MRCFDVIGFPLRCRPSRNWRQKVSKGSLIAHKQRRHWRRRWTSYLIIWKRKTSRTQSSKRGEFKEPTTQPGAAPAWLRSSQVTRQPAPLWSCSDLRTLCPPPSSSYIIHACSWCLLWHLSSQNRHTRGVSCREFMLSDCYGICG